MPVVPVEAPAAVLEGALMDGMQEAACLQETQGVAARVAAAAAVVAASRREVPAAACSEEWEAASAARLPAASRPQTAPVEALVASHCPWIRT